VSCTNTFVLAQRSCCALSISHAFEFPRLCIIQYPMPPGPWVGGSANHLAPRAHGPHPGCLVVYTCPELVDPSSSCGFPPTRSRYLAFGALDFHGGFLGSFCCPPCILCSLAVLGTIAVGSYFSFRRPPLYREWGWYLFFQKIR